MSILADRFDLRTGAVREANVGESSLPRVCVVAELPTPAPLQASKRVTEEIKELRNLAAVAPVRPGVRMELTVTELEAYLSGRNHGATPANSWPRAEQFTTEDGSDRLRWVQPYERLGHAGDQVFRQVWERWPVNDPGAWRGLLAQALAGRGYSRVANGRREFWGRALADFAASKTFMLLQGAVVLHRFWEFVASLEVEGLPGRVTIRGQLDGVWQDRHGGWHVLQFDCGEAGPEGSVERGASGEKAVPSPPTLLPQGERGELEAPRPREEGGGTTLVQGVGTGCLSDLAEMCWSFHDLAWRWRPRFSKSASERGRA
jgi:hypothetical protein